MVQLQTPLLPNSLTTLTSDPPLLSSHQSCLFKMAVVTITSVDMEAKAHILFNEGSQHSFLTQELADTNLTIKKTFTYQHLVPQNH